jgi:hypothetical protein
VSRLPGREAAVGALRSLANRVGAHTPERAIWAGDGLLNHLEAARWLQAQGHRAYPRLARREQLFALAAERAGPGRVLCLEFGVFRGDGTRAWLAALGPAAQVVGFDRFEGLPTSWNAQFREGHFSTAGHLPAIDDPRVSFVKGDLAETLPGFRLPEHDALIVVVDVDLLSAAELVLDTLADEIAPGTLVYLDEFSDRHHELLAFDQHVRRTGYRYRLLGTARYLSHALFERIA